MVTITMPPVKGEEKPRADARPKPQFVELWPGEKFPARFPYQEHLARLTKEARE